MIVQFGLAFFGLLALYMTMGTTNKWANFWAPVVGLLGQPFWFIHAIDTGAYGIIVSATVFTLVYCKGLYIQLKKAKTDRQIH